MSDGVELPDWPQATVVILVTTTAPPVRPHAIPVSAAVRAGPDRVLIGLSRRRESLARLRADPEVTLVVCCAGAAFSADGRAVVVAEELVQGVAAVAVTVHAIHDHRRPTFALDSGVGWHWTDAEAARADADVRSALRRLSD